MASKRQDGLLEAWPRLRVLRPRDFGFSLLVAGLSCQGGTPWTAFPLLVAINLFCTWLLRSDGYEALSSLLNATRSVPKAVQFLAVALFVTALFALEMQDDIVPNAFGFIELVAPTVAAAVFFDASGGLFSAVLVAIYGFQVFAPPRFEAILDITSFAKTLGSFGVVSFLSALHFSSAAGSRVRSLCGMDEWGAIQRHWTDLLPMALRPAEALWALVRRQAVPIVLVLGYALFWSTFAWISSGNGLHIDSLEAYAWGREFGLGYYKHPPFWAWIAGAYFSVVPKSEWAFLFLSELNAALGLAGVWVVMGRFCDQRTRLLGLFILMLTPFYQFNAQRFNANTILLSLWPWTIYFFIRTMETRRIIYAIACGALAGCALLSKYFAIILIASCFAAALTHDNRKRYFRSAAPYVSTIVAGLVFAPHALWLVRNGFQPLAYLAEKIDLADRHISNSYFQFIGANVLFFLIPVALLLIVRWRYGSQSHNQTIATRNGPSFLSVLAVAPFILTLFAGTVGHAALAIPFGVPIFGLVPLCIILLLRIPVEPALRVTGTTVLALAAICAIASPFLPGAFLRWGSSSYAEPRNEIADAAIETWQSVTGMPLRYVSGGRPYSLAVTFRSQDNVSEFNDFNPRRSPWVTPENLRRQGLLVICRLDEPYCLQQVKPYETASTIHEARRVARRIGNVAGAPVDFTIVVIPPARS